MIRELGLVTRELPPMTIARGPRARKSVPLAVRIVPLADRRVEGAHSYGSGIAERVSVGGVGNHRESRSGFKRRESAVAKLYAELVLLRGLTFCAAITGVLIVRVVAEARDDGIEAFPSGGEIDQRSEYRSVLVERELHPLQYVEYCVLQKSHMSFRSGCLTPETRAATVRVCAVAEWCERVS